MLTLFPSLLMFTFFTPTILRIAVSLVFFYMAIQQFNTKKQLAEARSPIVGVPGPWVPWTLIIVEVILGGCLLVGYYTQVAAMVGMIAALKYFLYRRFLPNLSPLVFPVSTGTMAFVFVICLSLLITGAGAFAFDIPL